MHNLRSYLCSSVGKKQIVAITGLIWSGFALSHMLGNCLLFMGSDAYNKYSYALITNPAIELAECVLVVALLIHMGLAIRLTIEGRRARGIPPHQCPSNKLKGGSFASRTMILSGLLILGFIIWHLLTFKYGPVYTTSVHGVEMRDLYKLVMETFQQPLYVGLYVLLVGILSLHVSHGVSALFQTFGLGSIRSCWIKKIGCIFSAVLFLGFASQPIFFFLKGGN